MGCHGISYDISAFIFEDNIVWRLSGPIEQIYIHNEVSYVFNVSLITPSVLAYPMVSLIFKLSLIFKNMQMRNFP